MSSGPPPSARAPRLGIPTRIALAFAAVVVSFGIVSVLTIVQHQRTAATLRLLQEGYLPLSEKLTALRATNANFESVLALASETGDTNRTRWLAAAREARLEAIRRALRDVRRSEDLIEDPADARVLGNIRATLEAARTAYERDELAYTSIDEAMARGDLVGVRTLVPGLEETQRTTGNALVGSSADLRQRISDISLAAGQAERTAVRTIAVLGFAALLFGIFVTWWSRRLLRPLPALEERVLAVARGDLSRQVVAEGRDDEIGRLAREFERMVEALGVRDQRLRDVAETLRELQKMQEQIVTSLRAAVVVVTSEREVRAANAAARAVLGEAAVKPGLHLRALGERLPGLRDVVDRVARTGESESLAAVTLVGGERQTVVDVLVSPFGDAGEGDRAVLIVADDVTEALRTKERLLKSERLAAMGRMAAHVTHEVRNPLSSIGLNAELLADELHGKKEAEELLRAIQREVDRLTAITEEYLRVARLPAPMLVAESAGDITLAAARFVEREMNSAGVKLETKIEPDLPPLLLDEAQIRQALLNLLRNAREAMPEGGRVSLEVRAVAGGVAIEVADEGAGIPDAGKERIFELFFSTKEKGTGLGLTLTREIVLAHGGRLEVRDRSPHGTVFAIWLPRAPAPAPEGRAAA